MTAFITHFSFEFRTGIRNRTLLMMNYLLPLGFYLFMGFIMAGINPDFLKVLTPAMAIFAVLAATLLGIPDPLVNARENGIFRSYKINGIPTLAVLVIPALTTILHLLIVALIITLSAGVLFDAPMPVNWPNYILIFASLALASAGLSLLIGVISANSRITVLWSQVVFLPSILLSGMMFPYSMLPGAAGKVAQLLPATHAMNAFNGLAMETVADFSPWGSVFVLLLTGLIAILLAVYLFSWDSRNTTRRGHPLMALLVLLPGAAGAALFSAGATLDDLPTDMVIPISEPAHITGKIVDPGAQDSFLMTVSWGDSEDVETFNYPAGTKSFSESHTYQDAGNYTVTVELRGGNFGSDLIYLNITVDTPPGDENEGS
jgi:ABC-2 type transport system permease protein